MFPTLLRNLVRRLPVEAFTRDPAEVRARMGVVNNKAPSILEVPMTAATLIGTPAQRHLLLTVF